MSRPHLTPSNNKLCAELVISELKEFSEFREFSVFVPIFPIYPIYLINLVRSTPYLLSLSLKDAPRDIISQLKQVARLCWAESKTHE